MTDLKFIVADDHPLIRDAFRHTLANAFEGLLVDEAATYEELTGLLAESTDYDLVLLDLKFPGVKGFSGLADLRANHPDVPVMVVSAFDDTNVIRTTLELGASGFIPKSSAVEHIREAAAVVLDGGIWTPEGFDPTPRRDEAEKQQMVRLARLTPQQVRVLKMIGEGRSNREIGQLLAITEATAKAHVTAILQKLEVNNRTQAAIMANKVETPAQDD